MRKLIIIEIDDDTEQHEIDYLIEAIDQCDAGFIIGEIGFDG